MNYNFSSFLFCVFATFILFFTLPASVFAATANNASNTIINNSNANSSNSNLTFSSSSTDFLVSSSVSSALNAYFADAVSNPSGSNCSTSRTISPQELASLQDWLAEKNFQAAAMADTVVQAKLNAKNPDSVKNASGAQNVNANLSDAEKKALAASDAKTAADINSALSKLNDATNKLNSLTDTAAQRSISSANIMMGASNGKDAAQVETPTRVFSADTFKNLNGKTFNGPIGFGFIVDSTIRVGKCPVGDTTCGVVTEGLKYKTGGTGLSSVFTESIVDVKDDVANKLFGLDEGQVSLRKEMSEDAKSLQAKLTTVAPAATPIQNYFQVGSFSANPSTTCNNSNCVISTYSTFDKHFNELFSASMVVTSFGPLVWGSLSKGIGFTGKLGEKVNEYTKKVSTNVKSLFPAVSEFMSKRRLNNMNRVMRENEWDKIFAPYLIEMKGFSSGAGGYNDILTGPDSPLKKIPMEKRALFTRTVRDLQIYAQESAERMSKLMKLKLDDIERAKDAATEIAKWDSEVNLDFPAWVFKNPEMTGLGSYAIKKTGFPGTTGMVDLTAGAPYQIKGIMEKFGESGNFLGSKNNFVLDAAGNLELYRLKATGAKQFTLSVADLDGFVAKSPSALYFARIGADDIPVSAGTLDLIKTKAATSTGSIDIFVGDYVRADLISPNYPGALTPTEFGRIISQDRILKRPNTFATVNMGSLLTYLKNEPSFANRSSLSFIDNIYKNQEDSLKNYFKFKSEGLFKVGVLPLFYYNAKAGLGNEKFSAFQLPDTWSTISIYTPNNGDAIYNDAYVDFYSHEGSFQGDVFSKFLNSGVFLSTELIKGALTSIAPGVKNFFSNFTGENGAMGNILGKTTLRDTADDLLFLSHNETCSDCVTSMKFDDTKNKLIVDRFTSKQTINVYILETASTELVDEKGSTLINYAHHTNIGGEVAGNDMKPIDLSQSRTLGLTCEQKLYECDPTASKELGGGLLSWQSKGGTTGGLMQGVETLSYVINPGWGLFFSLLQQLTITSCLQDCVDDKEGYYVHLSVPPSSTTAKAKETSSTAATNLNSSIQGMANFAAENVDKLISSSNSSGAGSAKNSMVSALNNVLKTAQNTKTLYTKLSMGVEGSGFKIGDVQNITGSISAKEIAYIWSGGTISNDPLGSANTPSALTDGKGNSINVLPTDNKIVLEDAQGNKKEINLLNGPELQGNSELAFPKGKGSYPIRTSQLTDLTSLQGNIFEISREGKVFVSNPILLDCIQSAVMAQTGVPLDGAELVSAFGPLSQITYFENTSTGAGVSGVGSSAVSTGVAGNLISTPSTLERILTVNGGVFQLSGAGLNTSIGNVSAKALIDAKLNLSLTDNSTPTPVPIGKFKIMKFNNGVIWVDGANTLHVYLARNEKAILNSKDGQGLTGNPSTTMGADGCEQPAIDLQAQPNLNDALGTVNVSNFNASMQTMGPFTKFQTPDKIYDFYSKKVNGECKNFYRVIDRATGKVLYDKEIVGPLTKGEDGSIKFQTIDGVNHSMKFGTNSNGDPTITVDGKAQENLLSAQGPNGSFYYDPATRNWIPENTFNVNLSDGFKNNGATLGPNGMVPGSPITLNVGNNSDKGGFSIPSAPEDILSRLAMLSLLLIIFSVAFTTMRNKKHEIVIKK